MKVLHPAIAVVLATQSIPGVSAGCFFGSFKCGDGETHCLNPASVASCTFTAISPIVLDKIIPAVGNALKAVTPDELDFVIDLGVQEVTDAFTDFRDCIKMFDGKVTKCEVLHDVHACVSTALLAAKQLKTAGKFAKMATTQMDRANNALDLVESQVIPKLQEQCAGGCFNAPTCSVPVTAAAQVVQTTTTTTTKTECYNTSVDPTPVTLEYKPPEGCTCLAMSAHSYDYDADAKTTNLCARNVAYYMDSTLLGKAYMPDMGCFVGKHTNNGCTDARVLEESEVMMTYDFDYNQNDMQFFYFIPCKDQFGRKYSERNNTVQVTPAPTPASTYCKTYNITTTTNTTTNTTTKATDATTSTKPSGATVWERASYSMIGVCVALLAVPTWWLVM